MSTPPQAPASRGGKAPPLTLGNKLAYGYGSVAFGVKNNGFDYFLLLFYSLVVGLDGRLVGLALTIALVFDALSDPIVGYVSDNWRSKMFKWGRRHPFMYVAAAPVALSYFLLWNPPTGADQTTLFIYLVVLSIIIRTLITLYETPSSSMVAELASNYDERTSLLSYRYYFGWTGGNLMSVLMWGVLLVSTEQYPEGRANLDGWYTYGIIGSFMMFTAILVSALGTHNRIPYMHEPPAKRTSMGLKQIFSDIYQTLSDKSFGALFLASLFSAIATGTAASMAFIVYTVFWEFTTIQIFWVTVLVFLSAIGGAWIAPRFSRAMGKKKGALVLGILAFGIAPLPVLLRYLGWFPENGDPLLFPLILTISTIDTGFIIGMSILFGSMVADLVEQSEIKTERRSEGVFFAAITFTRKTVQGIGVLVSGFILSIAGLDGVLGSEEITQEKVDTFALLYVPTLWVLWGVMLACIGLYRIDRAKHESNLSALAERKSQAGAATSETD